MLNKRLILLVLIIAAVIWLPTGFDDLWTTFPIISSLIVLYGIKTAFYIYLSISALILLLLWRFGVLKSVYAFLK